MSENIGVMGADIDPVTGNFIQKKENDDGEILYGAKELPPLKPDYIRCVHITNERMVDQIVHDGLNYENQGMLSSTARMWGNESEVEYTSSDPRFSFEGAKAVVFDIPAGEAKLHNDIVKSPGIVPSKYLVGVIDAQPPNTGM